MSPDSTTAVPPSLSIFFPMYNEEENILPVLDTARSTCEELVADGQVSTYEIIVVNDASTDGTGKLADEEAARDPHIRVVHHPVNRKLGGAMKSGFTAATGELILYSDGDLPFDMQELKKAVRVQRLYDADIISVYRHDRTTEGLVRAVYTHAYNGLLWALFGLRIRDVNFSFKLCRREIFEHITLASEGSFIDAELLIRAERLGYRIVQFGTDYFPRIRGTSTLASPGVILTIVAEMRSLRQELKSIQPVRR
jgi:glycosyltransferase involved in cell wall biosynthesis